MRGKNRKEYGCPSCAETFPSFGLCRAHLQVCSPELLLETKGLQQRCTIGHRMCIVKAASVTQPQTDGTSSSLSTILEQETVTEGGNVQEHDTAAVAQEQNVGAVVETKVENTKAAAAPHNGERESSGKPHGLPVGVWQSHRFPSSLEGRVLVLWDLDQGSWRSHGVMDEWRTNVQHIVKQHCCETPEEDDAVVFVGGINTNVPNRNYWHHVLDEHSKSAANTNESSWWQSWAFQLNVVPCTNQAVDEKLRQIGRAATSSAKPPKAVVLITLDLDFLPILHAAKTHKVKSILLFRSSKQMCDVTKSAHFLKMKEACDVCVVVNKKTARPLEPAAPAKKKRRLNA